MKKNKIIPWITLKEWSEIMLDDEKVTLPYDVEIFLWKKAVNEILDEKKSKWWETIILISTDTWWIKTKINNIIFEQ